MPEDFSAEETDDPNVADDRGFCKVALWDRDWLRPTKLIHAGNRIDRARAGFDEIVRHRPGDHCFIRQGARELEKWPKE